ncbi:MAG: hypothetical protein WCI73_02290 [Phycisphaerae bacterium]
MRIAPLLAACLLPCLLVVGGCALLPDHELHQFRKVGHGMTAEQVTNLMGAPTHLDVPVAMKEGDKLTQFYIWETKRERFVVGFQEGKVVNSGYSAK